MGRKKDDDGVFFNNNYYGDGNNKKKKKRNYYNQFDNNQYYNQNNQYNYNNTPNNNDQFYGQYSYSNTDNYNKFIPEDKKDKEFTVDKKLFIGIGAIVAIVILIIVVIIIVTSNSGGKNDTPPEDEPPIDIKYDDDTIIVGDNNIGYLEVPANWVQEPTSNGLNIIDSEDSRYMASILTSKDTIDNVKDNLLKGLTSVKVNSFMFDGYKAYQVIGYYESSSSWMSAIFFNTEDGVLHFASVMGPDIQDKKFDVVTTYTLKR